MAWYDETNFYHIYPLGLCGAPKENKYDGVEHNLKKLDPWIDHIKNLGCNGIYIGPLFESVGHGYETTDYKKLDSRLGDNDDLKAFVKKCHDKDIKVVFDGVFNHTGRDFFAFKDLKENRENSRYKDWYCNVNFWGNNEYNDGFSYDNWGGYNLLVKLNQWNPEVRDYICDVIRFWVKEFDIDGIRLDAADVLDFEFMKCLRNLANEIKEDFWLMGEVIHGDYTRWVNNDTLHAVTNYVMHKALYSGHNDHNYFEIAHTQKRLNDMSQNNPLRLRLYNFVDNHDVERIYNKLNNKAHLVLVHILLYTLPGVPSIYYGSEFGIEGKKERGSDDSLRPVLNLEDFKDYMDNNVLTKSIKMLGEARKESKALNYGIYRELLLTNRQYAYARTLNPDSMYYDGKPEEERIYDNVVITLNNDDNPACLNVPSDGFEKYKGVLSGREINADNGRLNVNLEANSGEVWLPVR
ncbi:MAG: alpha-amylase [Lachnobacterium sp.]|nr:alpha-amylase [Lachnobacterium sp.]